jgi:serine/threonine protein kinase
MACSASSWLASVLVSSQQPASCAHAHTRSPGDGPKLSGLALPIRLLTTSTDTNADPFHSLPPTSAVALDMGPLGDAEQPQHRRAHSLPSSKGFFPPETLLEDPAGYELKPVDLFALGCVVLELVIGHSAFEVEWLRKYNNEAIYTGAANRALITTVFEESIHTCAQIVRHDHPSIAEHLFGSLLNIDPARRVPFERVIHPVGTAIYKLVPPPTILTRGGLPTRYLTQLNA